MRGLIENFGHFWKRQYIQPGGPRNPGHLKGYVGKRIVDFRDQIAIYVLYDRNFAPVYVGQAGGDRSRLFSRLREHEIDHLSVAWEYFSWFGFLRVGRGALLEKLYPRRREIGFAMTRDHIEGLLITALGPRLNRQGARWSAKSWREGEYFQLEDDELHTLNRSHLSSVRDELKREIRLLKRQLASRRSSLPIRRSTKKRPPG